MAKAGVKADKPGKPPVRTCGGEAGDTGRGGVGIGGRRGIQRQQRHLAAGSPCSQGPLMSSSLPGRSRDPRCRPPANRQRPLPLPHATTDASHRQRAAHPSPTCMAKCPASSSAPVPAPRMKERMRGSRKGWWASCEGREGPGWGEASARDWAGGRNGCGVACRPLTQAPAAPCRYSQAPPRLSGSAPAAAAARRRRLCGARGGGAGARGRRRDRWRQRRRGRGGTGGAAARLGPAGRRWEPPDARPRLRSWPCRERSRTGRDGAGARVVTKAGRQSRVSRGEHVRGNRRRAEKCERECGRGARSRASAR